MAWTVERRWVCPHWEFFYYLDEESSLPFAERMRETTGTHLALLNFTSRTVGVRATFFDEDGAEDRRFGIDGSVPPRAVWLYRTDIDTPSLPRPADGESASGAGWFEVEASDVLYLEAHVHHDKYTHHPRAWAYPTPLYEAPLPRLRERISGPLGLVEVLGSALFGRGRTARRVTAEEPALEIRGGVLEQRRQPDDR